MAEFLTRAIEFGAADGDAIPCVISTEAPVDRGDFIEILSHRSVDIDLSRAPLPLIVQHDLDRLNIGVVENLTVGDGKLRGIARFSSGEQARQILADIKAGIVRNLSVGYQLFKELSTQGRTKRFAWGPYEASVVAVPADPGAGFYRSFSKGIEMENTETLTRSQRRAENNAAEAELSRRDEIAAMGDQFAHLGGDQIASNAIRSGWSVERTRQAILGHVATKPLPSADFGRFDLGLSPRDVRSYSLMRAIRALTDPGAREEAGFELECSRAVEQQTGRRSRGLFIPQDALKRDLTVGTATAGGHTVATELSSNFIDVLRNRSQVLAMGATQLNGLVGHVAIPRKTATSTAYWVAENAAPTESSLAFDQVSMTPKSVSGFVDISRKLLLQSSLDIEGLVRADLAGTLANAIDLAAINGSGSGAEPTGILNMAGIGSVAGGTNGLAPTWAHIVDLEAAVAVANADVNALGYLTNAKVRGKLLKTEKAAATGQFVWADGEYPLRGYRAGVSEQMPSNLTKGTASGICSAILFANWTDLLIGMWGGLDLLVDPYSQSSTGAVRVVAFQDVDIAVRHAASFAAMKDALTS